MTDAELIKSLSDEWTAEREHTKMLITVCRQLKDENKWLRRIALLLVIMLMVAMASEYIARHHA